MTIGISMGQEMSDSLTGFTQFALLEEKPPDGCMLSGWRLTRKQLTCRPHHLCPELWTKLGRDVKLKDRQKWAIEKPKLDNARRLRGNYFIDLEDKEFKETIKNARKKLETSVAPAMPCKIMKNCGNGGSDKNKTKLVCILEANESTRMRMGNSEPSNHEDHIAGKGENSLQHYNLVHKFIVMCFWKTIRGAQGDGVPILQEIRRTQNQHQVEHCVFGSHTFVPISWMCKKQTSVSHSSTESEIISLDAGLRLDGIPAIDLWDLIVPVLGNTNQSHKEQGDLLMNKREVCSPPLTIHKRKQCQRVINDLDTVDFFPSNVQSSHQEALLYVFEDNEAVIKMIIKGRSPTMRHVSRNDRVALDWLFDRINLDTQNSN